MYVFTNSSSFGRYYKKTIHSNYDIPIAIGGVHVTGSISDDTTSVKFLSDVSGVNLIFLNESEVSFREFVKYVNTKKNFDQLSQLLLVNKNGLLKFENRLTPSGEDLNIIPNHKKMRTGEVANVGKIGGFFHCFLKRKNFPQFCQIEVVVLNVLFVV